MLGSKHELIILIIFGFERVLEISPNIAVKTSKIVTVKKPKTFHKLTYFLTIYNEYK